MLAYFSIWLRDKFLEARAYPDGAAWEKLEGFIGIGGSILLLRAAVGEWQRTRRSRTAAALARGQGNQTARTLAGRMEFTLINIAAL